MSSHRTDSSKNPGNAHGTTCITRRVDKPPAHASSTPTGTSTGTTSTGTTVCSATKNTTTPVLPNEPDIIIQTVGTIKSDPDTLDELLSRTSNYIQVSNPMNIHRLTESNVIKSSYVKLRKLNEADIQLWRKAGTSSEKVTSKVPSIISTKITADPGATRQTGGKSRRKQTLSKSSKSKSLPKKTLVTDK